MSADPGASSPGSRRRLLIRSSRAAAVALVVALLGLLVWDLVDTSSGASFVTEIERGKKPAAPAFALPVLWDRRGDWPAPVGARAAARRGPLRGVRGSSGGVHFFG